MNYDFLSSFKLPNYGYNKTYSFFDSTASGVDYSDIGAISPFDFSNNSYSSSGFNANTGASDYSFFNFNMFYYNLLLNGSMPIDVQKSVFSQNYNTNSNLASLKDVYNPNLGSKLANIADKNAQGSLGWCYRDVSSSVSKAGLGSLTGEAAYQAADKLASDKKWSEVSVSQEELKTLPAGCVIVWDKSSTTPRQGRLSDVYGHIVVTLGDGNAVSDHKERLKDTVGSYAGKFRVFVPSSDNGTKSA